MNSIIILNLKKLKPFIYLIKNWIDVNILTKSHEIHSLLFNNHQSNHHVHIRIHRVRMWLRSLLLPMEIQKSLKVDLKHV